MLTAQRSEQGLLRTVGVFYSHGLVFLEHSMTAATVAAQSPDPKGCHRRSETNKQPSNTTKCQSTERWRNGATQGVSFHAPRLIAHGR